MTSEKLMTMLRLAEKASETIRHPKDCRCVEEFGRGFKPAACVELVKELLKAKEDLRTLTKGVFIKS